jgi:hypothetical protein
MRPGANYRIEIGMKGRMNRDRHRVDRVHRDGTRAKHTEAARLGARRLIRRYIEERTGQPWTPPAEAPNRKLRNSARCGERL